MGRRSLRVVSSWPGGYLVRDLQVYAGLESRELLLYAQRDGCPRRGAAISNILQDYLFGY